MTSAFAKNVAIDRSFHREFMAAGYTLACRHHDDPFSLLVTTPAFWTLIAAWLVITVILVVKWIAYD